MKVEQAQITIKKYQDEIKKLTDNKIDVMSLENRAYLLSKGYLDIGNDVDEQSNQGIIGMNLIKKANAEMLAVYSLTQMRIKASNDIIK